MYYIVLLTEMAQKWELGHGNDPMDQGLQLSMAEEFLSQALVHMCRVT